MIIVLIGQIGAGKSTVSRILENQGFTVHKISDFIREQAKQMGLDDTNRTVLQDLGNEVRARFGAGYWALQIANLLKDETHGVIDGVRNINELAALRECFGDRLISIALYAPAEIRYSRRYNPNVMNAPSFETFQSQDNREMSEDNAEHEFSLKQCLEMCDVQIRNEGSMEELEQRVLEVVTPSSFAAAPQEQV